MWWATWGRASWRGRRRQSDGPGRVSALLAHFLPRNWRRINGLGTKRSGSGPREVALAHFFGFDTSKVDENVEFALLFLFHWCAYQLNENFGLSRESHPCVSLSSALFFAFHHIFRPHKRDICPHANKQRQTDKLRPPLCSDKAFWMKTLGCLPLPFSSFFFQFE